MGFFPIDKKKRDNPSNYKEKCCAHFHHVDESQTPTAKFRGAGCPLGHFCRVSQQRSTFGQNAFPLFYRAFNGN